MRKNFSALGQIVFILKFTVKFLWETDKKSLLIAVILNIFYSLIIIPNLLLDKLFIDTLVQNVLNPNPLAAFRLIVVLLGVRFGLQTLRSITTKVAGYHGRLIFWRVGQRMEMLVGTKYATIPVATIEDPSFKDRYQRIERESLNRMQRITDNVLKIPQHIAGVVSALSFFVVSQPIIAIVSLVSLVPAIAVERIFIKKDFELDTKILVRNRHRGLYYYFLGRGRSYMELRLLNIHTYLSSKINILWNEVIGMRSKLMASRRTWGALASVVDDVVSFGQDGWFAYQTIVGQITIGTAQAYVRAIGQFKTSISSLTQMVLELYEHHLYLTDLVWFLNLETPYTSEEGKKFPKPIKRGITFDDVWFKYPGSNTWILKGVSFTIDAKQNIALVGENGSGKTTLVKLLCGFYVPDKGSILIDGIPVSALNKTDYWKSMSVLFQDFEYYNVVARESIAVSHIADVDNLEKVRKYAKLSDIDEWIEGLPLKYENPLSRDFEKGAIPSTGQWQRIGIARTLFKEGEIVVLDEPTSNVDPKAEEDIFNRLLKLGKDKILVFISHRFSTVRKAERIILLEKGVVSENGTHEELMAKKGTYAELFNLQAKSYQ